MGDSPPVLITALTNESSTWRTIETPWIEEDGGYGRHLEPRDLVLYDTVDTRLLFADFFARMQLAAARLGTSSEAGDHDD